MAASRMAGAPSSPAMALAHESGSNVGGVEEEEVDHGRDLAEHGHPLLDHGGHGREGGRVEGAGGPRDGRRPSSHGRHASTKSSADRARMYSPFMWVSLATSKKAGEWLTSARRNHSTIWSRVKISDSSSGGLHPSRPR